MPQDPNLYGQRPAKKQKREIPLSSSLTFASQLTSLLATPSTSSSSSPTATSGRPRPSKTKDDIFSQKPNKPNKPKSKEKPDAAVKLKEVHGTEDEKQERARARRKMEEKARLYAAMKRGDYIAKENDAAPLVDFDRKWAERHPEHEPDRESSSGSDNESSDNDNDAGKDEAEMVEYKDEFGRTRTGTKAEVHRLHRRAARSALGAAELVDMAARPAAPAPSKLIYGDTIQTAAFAPEDVTLDAMAFLASKRDKSPTPPPDTHFDGKAEIRTKGAGFYQFSTTDESERVKAMENLKKERENTERVRAERESVKDARRREIEERRRKIEKRRAEKMADSFLSGLAGEMGGGDRKNGDGANAGAGAPPDPTTNQGGKEK